ncbi:RENT2-like protein [Mya arenaria]|uniref:RENT2-like protein n=1 Tax=Mya arenaria TaxID=6604 RepID=A0ABY7FXL2_MYAAR|nr:RENT2-like protein [Mya arenaria]
MSGRAEDRRPARGGSESKGRGTRPSSGGGKSYRELRYQAGRGSGRGPRGGGPSDRDRHSDRDRQSDRDRPTSRDHRSSEKPVNELGDGDASKPKQAESSPTKTAKPVPSKVLSAAELEAQWQKEEEEKKQEELRKAQEEEERKRQAEEAERLRKEDEERRQEEERQRKEAEDRKCIEDFIADCKARNAEKLEQRKANLNADENRPEERFFGKLDSSLKKNTAFVKKLAVSIVEAKLKMSDIGCAIHLCSILHQRYAEFVPALLENWQKCFPTKKDEKISNPSKYRVDLRFFAELVSVGVFRDKEGLPILSNQLAILINNDKEAHNNLSILSSFCKHCGDDYAGLLPRKFRLLAERFNLEVPKSTVLAKERKKGCRNLLKDYYTSLCKHLLADHKNLKNMEKQNRKTLLTKGELSQDRKERFEEMYNNYQKLFSNSLDLLDEDMPDLPEDDMKDDDGGLDIFNPLNMEFQYDGDTSLWEDEETRTLYESLPDLKASIPGILYKESESAARDQKEADSGLEDEMENLEIEDVEREMETQKQLEEQAQSDPSGGGKEEGKEEEDSEQLLPPVVEDDEETGSLMKVQFEAYAQSLPTCVNRDLIDKAAIEFCMNFNTKNNRKKLVRALYDLLPFYSRLVATLYPCMPDVANDLTQLIKGDFRWHDVMMRKKSALMLDSRYTTMIENAYYYSNPPDAPQVARKVRPPMHEYIRKLLYKDLSKITTEKVLRQMRKLDWEDPEIGFYTTKCLIAVWNVRFNSIHCAANLLAGIAPYHINHPKYNQRRVSCAKFLGELYNYRMVESAVIFKTLYSFITFGVASNEGEVSMLDSPDHLFRIRLRYYWFKKSLPVWSELRPFPVDAENLMQDTMDAVRPKLKMYASFEEASTACEELEKELKPKIAGLLPIVETEDPEASDVSLSEKTFEEEESSEGEDGYGDEDEEEEEEETEMDTDHEMDNHDDEVILKSLPKRIECPEDDDFMAAFDKMIEDTSKARNNESIKVPQFDVPVPVNMKGSKKKFEMLASMNRPLAINNNRERRVRYQHPKGAPDADEIFGSKAVIF